MNREKFTAKYLEASSGNCKSCKNRVDQTHCLAFPEGIPLVFLTGKNKHLKPFKGDNGITFEPK